VGTSAVRVTGDDGAQLGPHQVGEVWLRAAGAPPRRLLDPAQAPAAAGTVRDGWTRTGDLGYLDADGYLFLAGRTTDIAIVGGFNVSMGRVEQVLSRHDAVAEATVFAVDHPVLGEIVAALVVLRAQAEATVRDLRRYAASQLSRRELPAVIRLVDQIPVSPAGKVVKRDLPRLLDAPGAAEFVPPRSAAEREIAAIWAQVLELGMVSVADNFFEVGGDSLAATRIAAEIRDRLGVAVDAVAVFEAPTVAELVEQIHNTEGSS
jgi:acyl carrier protein